MILETVRISVKPGTEATFEAIIGQARSLFARAPGCHGLTLHRSIEQPSDYLLKIHWETLAHHTVQFRGSDLFTQWRDLAGPYFAAPPVVEHSTEITLD